MFRGLQLLRSVFWDTKAALALFVLDIPRLLLSIGDSKGFNKIIQL